MNLSGAKRKLWLKGYDIYMMIGFGSKDFRWGCMVKCNTWGGRVRYNAAAKNQPSARPWCFIEGFKIFLLSYPIVYIFVATLLKTFSYNDSINNFLTPCLCTWIHNTPEVFCWLVIIYVKSSSTNSSSRFSHMVLEIQVNKVKRGISYISRFDEQWLHSAQGAQLGRAGGAGGARPLQHFTLWPKPSLLTEAQHIWNLG